MKEYDFVKTTKEIRTMRGVAIPKGVMGMKLNHIYCGDCIEVMRGFPDNSVDLIVTDPPCD